jgi:membrane protease YdiL (CAAX protease family)
MPLHLFGRIKAKVAAHFVAGPTRERGTKHASQRAASVPAWFPWAYLALLGLAEQLVASSPRLGALLHGGLLLAALQVSALRRHRAERTLAMALVLASLTRLVSLALPLGSLPQVARLAAVGLPFVFALALARRQIGLPWRALGLRRDRLLLQVMIAGGGLVLGALEYALLRPEPLAEGLSAGAVGLIALSLIVFSGLAEELLFRGLLQWGALRIMGRWGLLYGSLVFAAIHLSYGLPLLSVMAFAVGLLFASIVRLSGSIVGVALAHGLSNLMLFLVMPYLVERWARAAFPTAVALLVAGTAALFALTVLIRNGSRRRQQNTSSCEGPALSGANTNPTV